MDPVLDPMQNTAFIIFSAISPILIALIKQQGFSRSINAVIAFICYVVVGVFGALLSGAELSIENVVQLITIATVVGAAAYNIIWNNLLAEDDGSLSFDQRLTAATSIVK